MTGQFRKKIKKWPFIEKKDKKWNLIEDQVLFLMHHLKMDGYEDDAMTLNIMAPIRTAFLE